jgi:hypothetical protein
MAGVAKVVEQSHLTAAVFKNGERSYTRVFLVQMTSGVYGPYLASSAIDPVTAVRIPLFGSYYTTSYEFDLYSFVTEIRPRRKQDLSLWEVTVNYGQLGNQTTNPLDRPPEFLWERSAWQQTVSYDVKTGKEILNSAGEKFEDIVQADQSRLVLHVKRNEPIYDPSIASQYADHVNSDTFFGWSKNMVKCSPPKGTPTIEGDYSFFVVEYEFIFYYGLRGEGWQKKIVDQGFNELKNGDLVPIKENMQPINKPKFLHGGRVQYNAKGFVTQTPPDYLDFNIYPSIAFSGLAIPGS